MFPFRGVSNTLFFHLLLDMTVCGFHFFFFFWNINIRLPKSPLYSHMLESTYTHIHRQTHIITKTKMAIRDLLLHNRTFQYKPLLGALYHRQSVIDTSVATPSCCWSFWCILGRAWSEMLKYCHIHNLNDAGFSLAFRTSQRIFSLVPYLGGRMSQWDVKEDWFNLESCSGLMALTVDLSWP